MHQFETPECEERCHVLLLDKYFSKLLPDAFEADIFYLRPLASLPSDPTKLWYCMQPVGRNTLAAMMKTMAKQAGLTGNISNHSLQAYAATEMFQRGVREKLIKERTGHRSLEALRKYEHASEEQVAKVSHTLAGHGVSPNAVKFHAWQLLWVP